MAPESAPLLINGPGRAPVPVAPFDQRANRFDQQRTGRGDKRPARA
jgi:hypothetical protein|tara:strand:+ start:1811 stop:1948 length:138 start_codon:yes stop_codon:yes gene_type:complete